MRSSFASLSPIGGFLPGPGPLKRHVMLAQDQAQPLAPDPDLPVVTVGVQVGGEFPHTPVRERDAQRARSSGGRRDDECDVGVTDLAGTASRPPRVQRGQPPLVERVDDIPHGVLVGGDQPGDRRHRGSGCRRHDDRCSADPD
jgi:hypothetical protein